MLNYENNPQFSLWHSKKRMEKANSIFGSSIVAGILAFSLYLMGANRKALAQFLKMPLDTLKSFIKRAYEHGLPAFEDRRCKSSDFLPPVFKPLSKPKLIVKPDKLVVGLHDGHQKIEILRRNRFQCRTVLLTLLANGLLMQEEVAQALDLSNDRTRKLKVKLMKHDVDALIDKRKGQQQDYRVTSEIKAELIQQHVLNLTTGASTSSEQLSSDLQKRCQIHLASRTIRLHMAKLGLYRIQKSLPHLLHGLKKNSKM